MERVVGATAMEKERLAYEAAGTASEAAQPGQPSLLNRLHRRRRELENALRRVNNSIEFVEKNAMFVEIVEVVLASREKCEPGLLGL